MRKIIPYILILVVLVGFFGISQYTHAQDRLDSTSGATVMFCYKSTDGGQTKTLDTSKKSREECEGSSQPPNIIYTWGGVSGTGQTVNSTGQSINTNYNFDCGIVTGKVMGCVAELSYGVWTISASIARLAGHFLDFFIYYSTNSSSYANGFVTQGWGAVRDVANIFFIIALLYVAIKTVLSLDASGSKKLIANIILIALIINFSLFTTRVVVDASNILAKVFYNNITSKTKNVDGTITDTPTGAGGQKSISIGLVNKYNPQEIVSYKNYEKSPGNFVFITLLLLAITLYTAYIFFAVALLFVARVVSLWMAMIFSPLAFVSYTVPFDIPGFGHKEWWDDLLKNAFLAPLFVFFLYIIVIFTGFLSKIAAYPKGADMFQHLMSIVVPFVILVVLLQKAKKKAVDYSGKMGQAFMTAGKMVGGLALGAATGGAAIAGRATLGRAASAFANSATAKRWEARGYLGATALRRATEGVASGSFDVRKTAAGGALAKASGMNLESAKMIGLGSKEGGFEKARKDQVEKRQRRAESLKVGEDEGLKQNLNAVEDSHQELLVRNGNAHQIELLDNRIKTQAVRARDASRQARTNGNNTINPSTGNTYRVDAVAAENALKDSQGERSAIKNASMFRASDGRIIDHREATTDNNLSEDAITGIENTANAAIAAAAANPGNVALTNAVAIATAARDSALATRDVTLIATRDAAVTAAAANPADLALAEAAQRATDAAANVSLVNSSGNAHISAQQLTALAAANPNDIALRRASEAAANALNRIANGTTGRSINNLEDTDIPAAHHAVEHESKERQRDYATSTQTTFEHAKQFLFSAGQYSPAGASEAAHKIRMGAKLDSGSGGKGGEHS